MSVLQFVNRRTLVHQLSPLTKLFMVACLWTVSLVSLDLVVLGIIVTGCLLVWVLARIPLGGFKLAV